MGQGGENFAAGRDEAGATEGPWRKSQQEAGQMAVGSRLQPSVGANENRRKT